MAGRTDYFFRQKVTEAELDLAFELLELAVHIDECDPMAETPDGCHHLPRHRDPGRIDGCCPGCGPEDDPYCL